MRKLRRAARAANGHSDAPRAPVVVPAGMMPEPPGCGPYPSARGRRTRSAVGEYPPWRRPLASEIGGGYGHRRGKVKGVSIEATIRRSEIELASYELKQGFLLLQPHGVADPAVFDKVVNSICAIANNGPTSFGKILIGVADKANDAKRVKEVDGVEAKKIGKRYIVGVDREAKRLNVSIEKYFARWKEAINNSKLSEPLKSDCLSGIDYNSYYGLGMIIISIPTQKELSYVGDQVYWRNGDATELASSPKIVAAIAQRF